VLFIRHKIADELFLLDGFWWPARQLCHPTKHEKNPARNDPGRPEKIRE
jgi:hypothetical protein